jgi:hypothetical protein
MSAMNASVRDRSQALTGEVRLPYEICSSMGLCHLPGLIEIAQVVGAQDLETHIQ